jgi:hypothetical protein
LSGDVLSALKAVVKTVSKIEFSSMLKDPTDKSYQFTYAADGVILVFSFCRYVQESNAMHSLTCTADFTRKKKQLLYTHALGVYTVTANAPKRFNERNFVMARSQIEIPYIRFK